MKKWSHLLAAGAMMLSISMAHADKNVVYFYNWSEYVPPGLMDDFTKETGIKVINSSFESIDTMYTKLKTYKDGAYDLVVPSAYFVARMRDEGMIQKIDTSKLKNFKNIDPSLQSKDFDPTNEWSIPYTWGATGIAVNTDVIDPKTVTSWANLWDERFRDRILILDDAREVFPIALAKLGYSINTTDPKQIQEAYEEMRKLMLNVVVFNSDAPANPYIEGDIDIGMLWNGSSYMARQEGVHLQYIWPKEGAVLWMDSMAIPSNAKNVEGALKLIDYLLRPEVAAKIANEIGYPTPNLEARKLLPKSLTDDKSLYPDEETLKKGHWQGSVGKAGLLYETLFQNLKAGG